jgi:tetratricopeptide (TPR) repeat protein
MNNGAARRHDPDHHRNGLQHADAIRKSQSSLPIGDDINGPTSDSRELDRPMETQPPINSYTHYFFSPGDYNRYRSPLSQDERSWSRYRYFGGNPSRYGFDSEYDRFDNGPYGDNGDVYRYGFLRGYDRGRSDKVATERTERVLRHARRHYDRGVALFQEGMYHQAARTLRLASETDQGDPVSRIYAAHAHFAIGRYKDAVQFLRRAFDLQPKIAMLTYDLREDYKDPKEFEKQLAELERAIRLSPRRTERLILFGYLLSYSGQRDKAYEPLYKARSLAPDDALAKLLLENCDLPPDVVVERIKRESQR